MIIDFHKKFKKKYSKIDRKIQKKFEEKLRLFEQNPFDISLNNHQLTGDLKMYRSIDITGDWQAWYEPAGDEVVFVIIGTHSELYG